MTQTTPKKKTTTTKKKPTVKAHRGFAHVPLRGRGRPLRGFGGDPRRRRPPIQQPTGRRMTPAQRDALRRQQELARRRFDRQNTIRTNRELQARLRQGNLPPAQRKALQEAMRRGELGGRRGSISPYQRQQLALVRKRQQEALNPRGRPALPIRRRPTVEQLRNARRRRRPVGDPKPRTRVTQARQAPRTIRKPRRPV